jgi:catechol 2,3-dioxygenase-like lactoylglutathione lyase family enzyme
MSTSPSPASQTSLLGSSSVVAFVGITSPERAKGFYRDKLGLRLVSEDGFALVFDANGTMLRVSIVREVTPAQYTVLGWAVTDIAGTAKELEKAGVPLEHFNFLPDQDSQGIWTAPGGARVAWFKDPDGNMLSLSQHPK